MFSTIKGKIIFSVALVMVVSTVVNIYFTKRDVGNAMLEAQEKSARNILHSLDLVLRDDYQTLLKAKRSMTMSKRAQLKNAAQMIDSVLNGFYDPEAIYKQEIKSTLKWLKTAPFENIDYYLIDKTSNIMFSSNSSVTTDTYKQIEDIKHRNIAQAMRFENLKERGDFAIFKMGDQNKSGELAGSVLAYFLPFKPWKFTIGVSIDVSDIEAEAQEKTKKIISSLNEYSKQLKITKSGFVLMVDEAHNVLISPPEHDVKHIEKITRYLTNNIAIESSKASKIYAVAKIKYESSLDDKKQMMIVYSSYFKPLKWYTSVIIPINEINKPAQDLVIRQSLIIAIMFMVGLIAVFLLVTRIASPLRLLSSHAKELPGLDFTKPISDKTPIDSLPAKYKDEVGDLANSFIFMRKELNKNIQNLVKATASRQAIESELNIARDIQLGMVPKTFPSFPEHDEFDLYATLKPAKEIGGD